MVWQPLVRAGVSGRPHSASRFGGHPPSTTADTSWRSWEVWGGHRVRPIPAGGSARSAAPGPMVSITAEPRNRCVRTVCPAKQVATTGFIHVAIRPRRGNRRCPGSVQKTNTPVGPQMGCAPTDPPHWSIWCATPRSGGRGNPGPPPAEFRNGCYRESVTPARRLVLAGFHRGGSVRPGNIFDKASLSLLGLTSGSTPRRFRRNCSKSGDHETHRAIQRCWHALLPDKPPPSYGQARRDSASSPNRAAEGPGIREVRAAGVRRGPNPPSAEAAQFPAATMTAISNYSFRRACYAGVPEQLRPPCRGFNEPLSGATGGSTKMGGHYSLVGDEISTTAFKTGHWQPILETGPMGVFAPAEWR